MSDLESSARAASDGLHHCIISLISNAEKHRAENEELKERVALLEERMQGLNKASSRGPGLYGDENASEIMKALQMTGPAGAMRKLRTDDEVRGLAREVGEEIMKKVVLQLSNEAEVRVKALGTELRQETSNLEVRQNTKLARMEESLVERLCTKKRFEVSVTALGDEISRLKTELLGELASARKRILFNENRIHETESDRTILASMAAEVAEKVGAAVSLGARGGGEEEEEEEGGDGASASVGEAEAKGEDVVEGKHQEDAVGGKGGTAIATAMATGHGVKTGPVIMLNLLRDLALRQQRAEVRVENAVPQEDFEAFKKEAALRSKVKKISGELQRLKMEVLDGNNAMSDLDQAVSRHTDLHRAHSAALTQQKGSLTLLRSKAEEIVSEDFVEEVRRSILRDVDELRWVRLPRVCAGRIAMMGALEVECLFLFLALLCVVDALLCDGMLCN